MWPWHQCAIVGPELPDFVAGCALGLERVRRRREGEAVDSHELVAMA
jgi:hypothetical protein